MKVLASRIVEGLSRAAHFAVYEVDLETFWPASVADRESLLEEFAAENGFRLRFYKKGLCAIFDRNHNGGCVGNGTHSSQS